jgi:hypothetical protein
MSVWVRAHARVQQRWRCCRCGVASRAGRAAASSRPNAAPQADARGAPDAGPRRPWMGFQHRTRPPAQDLVAAVRFAGSWEELAGPLLALAWELAVRPAPAQRACAAALAGALVPCLPLQQARGAPGALAAPGAATQRTHSIGAAPGLLPCRPAPTSSARQRQTLCALVWQRWHRAPARGEGKLLWRRLAPLARLPRPPLLQAIVLRTLTLRHSNVLVAK